MKPCSQLVELIGDFTQLHASHVHISLESEDDNLHHFLNASSPSMSRQIRRFLSLTHDRNSRHVLECLCAETEGELTIFIDMYSYSNNYPQWDAPATLVFQGDVLAMVDLVLFRRAIHGWLDGNTKRGAAIEESG